MKKLVLAGLMALGLAAASYGDAWRIGVVDLERVFEEHPKTAAATAELKVQEEAVEAEMKQLVDEIEKKRAELQQAREAMNTPILSEAAREAKRAELDERETALGELQFRARKTAESKTRQLREQLLKVRQGIVDEMQKALGEFAAQQGFALLLDKSGLTMNGVSGIAYFRPDLDVTDALIKYIQNSGTTAPETP